MQRTLLAVICVVFLASAASYGQAVSPQRSVFNSYCVSCHNEKLKTAGLLLDKMDPAHVAVDAEQWEKVVRKLRAGAMPPAGLPRPDPATYESVASYLEKELDRAEAQNLNVGKLPLLHQGSHAEEAKDQARRQNRRDKNEH